jgi:hypothetical protein
MPAARVSVLLRVTSKKQQCNLWAGSFRRRINYQNQGLMNSSFCRHAYALLSNPLFDNILSSS